MSQAEIMSRDVYPAEVLLPDGTLLRGVRVFATTTRLLAYGLSSDRKIVKVLDAELLEPNSIPRSRETLKAGRLEAKLAAGTAWVNKATGCGCGSPLKALGAPVPWRA